LKKLHKNQSTRTLEEVISRVHKVKEGDWIGLDWEPQF
jgi:hypothetical protein